MSGPLASFTGQRVERMAERWLADRGLKPIARNYRCRGGELDLVMQCGDTLAIIEVKYRRPGAQVSALEALPPAKQRRIALTTLHFLQRHHQLAGLAVRFDLLAVTGRGPQREINWLRDAFRPAL